MPRKVFTAGEVLAAADVNEYLMDQAIMTFAGTAARGSAIGTATEGMVTYLADSDTFEFWDGTAYVPFGAGEGPTLEYLVIAGGGGGGVFSSGGAAGGGGAGGYRNNVSGEPSGGSAVAEYAFGLVPGTYPIIVGAGGAGGTGPGNGGAVGSNSRLIGIISNGGGGGQSSNVNTFTGGSGGGGFRDRAAGGLALEGQGSNGGAGNASFTGGAGGGGAGQVGANTTGTTGSNGGNGLASSITGSSVTRGGGGGGGASAGSPGTGGTGGGGNGGVDTSNGGDGTVNTGGGGGGTEFNANGGNGGSGIVIFTVPAGTSVSFSGGVTQTNSTISGKQVYVVTATSTTSETVTFS
jgi:hypothetical protein